MRMMSPSRLARRAGVVVLMALIAIELHELGHLAAYAIAGYPARMSFQRVDPLVDVPHSVYLWAMAAGPAASLAAAAILLAVARRRKGFAWVSAAFASASIRLFPCTMDLVRAIRGAWPFSDEGVVALGLAPSRPGRVALVLPALLASAWLTARAAREYRFEGRAALKSAVIYGLMLAVGMGMVLLDDLLGISGS